MDANNQGIEPIRRSRPIVRVICTAALAVPFILLVPAVQRARDDARRMSSGNHLKQIAMGLHNYHDAHNCLPAGGTFREDGLGLRGWPTIIVPYLEIAIVWGSDEDPSLSWDDPKNLDLYIKHKFNCYSVPGVSEQETVDGLPLIHYAANEWIMHRNSRLTFGEIEDRGSTLMVGEAFGEFRPWADVFNWRDPTVPFRTSPRQFGSIVRKTTLVALVDGSVASYVPMIDDEVFSRLAGPVRLRPAPELVERPTEPYRLKSQDYWRFLWSANGAGGEMKSGDSVRFRLSPDTRYLEAKFDDREPVSVAGTGRWRTRFKPFVESKPIEHVEILGTLDAMELEPFLEIPTLKRLSINSANIYGDKDAVLSKARKSILID